MKEVVFDNGKLVLQKRKISQMEELFLIASKEHDKRKKESGLDILGSAFSTRKDFNNIINQKNPRSLQSTNSHYRQYRCRC